MIVMWCGFPLFWVLFFFLFSILLFIFNFSSKFTKKLFSSRGGNGVISISSLGSLFMYILILNFILFSLFHDYTQILILLTISSGVGLSSPIINSELSSQLVTEFSFPFIYIFVLITFLASIFCLHYNRQEFLSFQLYLSVISLAGFFFFSAKSFAVFFLSYEMLLVPSFLILYNFAKTRRAIEAAMLMFFWTQFGAVFLLFTFFFLFFILETTSFEVITHYSFSSFEVNLISLCWLIGFGVKLPIWPFYGWLPKAHVEASTNFSIFLSGVLVKFAFFGLLKSLLLLQQDLTSPILIPILFVGLVDSSLKLFIQVDLKKIVAFSTVIEMHWLTICIFSGFSPLLLAGLAMLLNHALLSSNAFLLVDAINRRFKTRLITEFSGLNFLCPKLYILSLFNTLLFLGFPGSLTFVTEVLFFSFVWDLIPILTPPILIFLYLLAPSFFFRSWFNAMFGFSPISEKRAPIDLTNREFLSFASLELFIYYLGFIWDTFLL